MVTSENPPRRGLMRRIALVLAIAFAALVLALELGSRIADRVVASRKASTEFDAKNYKPGLVRQDRAEHAGSRSAARRGPHGTASLPRVRAETRVEHASGSAATVLATTPWGSGARRRPGRNAPRLPHRDVGRLERVRTERIQRRGGLVTEVGGPLNGAVFRTASSDQRRLLGILPGRDLINFALRLVDFHPDLLIQYEAINDMRCALYTRAAR
jgi:hypothetical protein